MKFYDILPFLALAILTSCSTEQEGTASPRSPITYSTGQTRFSDGCKFDKDDVISVWANYREGNICVPYIENQQITLSADNIWQPDVEYYWPSSNTLDFYSIFPTPIASVFGLNSMSIDAEAEKPLVAYEITDFNHTIDIIAARTEGVSCAKQETVPLHFKHVLGKLQFKVWNNCEYGGGMKIKVESLSINCKIHDKGHLDWESMSFVPDGSRKECQFEICDEEFVPYQERDLGNFFCIPAEEVSDIRVTAIWSIYNGDKVAETFKVTKQFDETFPLHAGCTTSIRLVLKRLSGGDNGDIIM